MCVCATDPACRGVAVGAHVAGLERVMRRGALWARRAFVPGSRRAVRGVSGWRGVRWRSCVARCSDQSGSQENKRGAEGSVTGCSKQR
jgi:hypothetical protein